MRAHHTRWALLSGAAVVATLAVAAMWPDAEPEHAEIRPEPTPPRLGQDECPAGASTSGSGPEMVRLPEDFCVDTTEVTRGHYLAWLETAPATDGQPAACADNESFEPSCAWPPNDNQSEQPVVCVDWCDARAYCEAAGKRLCGAVADGGAYPFDEYANPASSEWHAACTSGGRYAYTYGDEIDRGVCRGADAEDYTTWGIVDVGSLEGCRSPDAPYSELRDMNGNVAEWDNACEGDAPDSPCRVRGGSFEHQHHGLRCATGQNLRWPRMRSQGGIGFRCCAD